MADEPTRAWSDEQLKSDDLPKKDLIKFIQDNAAKSVCLLLLFPLWCRSEYLLGGSVDAYFRSCSMLRC